MKPFYVLLLFQIMWGGLTAQIGNICNNYCDRNLSTPITGLQIDSTNDLTDLDYCKKVSGNCVAVSNFDVHYTQNSCAGETPYDGCSTDPSATPLKMRVYYPKNHNYAACKLPAVIIFHAGGYSECGSYLNPLIRALARKLALRGFVVFDVNYRLGVIADIRTVPGSNPPVRYTTAQQWLAIYRGMQDARGAVRSIMQMQVDGVNSSFYQIDTSKVFLGGTSAGSVLALSSEYYGTQAKIDQVFPGISSLLGPIDPTGVYYADPPTSMANDYFGKIKGILNCWGSLLTPVAYLSNPYNFFGGQGYGLPPVISFHGMKDETFNYKRQGTYFSTYDGSLGGYDSLFQVEKHCLPDTFIVNEFNDNTLDYICIGSQNIYQMLRGNSIFSELYLDCLMGHGLDDDCSTPGCYQSDFGTSAINTDQTLDYIAGRAATFFQAILQGISGTLFSNGNDSKFTECENERVKCSLTDAGGCADDNTCP